MTMINNIMVSKTAPKKKNTGWVDMSQEPPTLKMFVNGRYVSVSGSSGIHYSNLSPTPMRDVTEEDLQKLPEPGKEAFYKAIDLQDGIVPYFVVLDINNGYPYCVYGLRYLYDDNYIMYSCMGEVDVYFCISSDGKFIALPEEVHETTENDQEPGDGGNTGGGGIGKPEPKQ